jgi:hypothetical protein
LVDEEGVTGVADFGGGDAGEAAFAGGGEGGAALLAPPGKTGGLGSLMLGLVFSGCGIFISDWARYVQ